ncbi:MAG: hypothetical protein WCO57_01355 [Verrucomicrobiota bacterium]
MKPLPLVLLVAASMALPTQAEPLTNDPSPPPMAADIATTGLTVSLAADGRVVGATLGNPRSARALTAATVLAGCRRDGATVMRKLADGSVTFQSHWVQPDTPNACVLVERFAATPNSVRWELEIRGDAAPWSTEILTQLDYPANPQTRFWAAWADPAQVNRPWFKSGGWSDPLTAMPLQDAAFDYGAPAFRTDNPRVGWCPFDGTLISLPLVSVLDAESDTGLSLVLSPEDTSRELTLRTTRGGRFSFARTCHRIDARRPIRFAMDLVAHEAAWRGSLRWLTSRYPQFFEPPNPQADAMAGTAAYSCQDVDFDVAKMRKMAMRVNWRASFDFPYMGMFLPPVAAAETWTRFGGKQTTLTAMQEYTAKMREAGFYVLSYFNVDEFGARVTWPLPPRKATRDEDLWKDCHDFLGVKLASAIMRIPERVPAQPLARSIYPLSRPGGPYFTWEDGIVMDCGDSAYRDFLLDQARQHIEKLPQTAGICIDRLDWLRLYNERADDGESWFEGRPARSLMSSWHDLMARLGPLMHQAGKVVFVNNHVKRLDLLRHTDGIFDEFTYTGAPLNLTALLALRKPALGWTDDEAALRPDPDGFFQRYLHLGVYPMAPFPGNDHSLRPSPWVDRQYLDYGPLLDAMRGKKWVLEPRCVESSTPGVKVNLFQVPGGYALPVTFGGPAASATLTLRNLPGLDRLRCEALHPGADQATPVTETLKDACLTLRVPLKRGCAMVLLRK